MSMFLELPLYCFFYHGDGPALRTNRRVAVKLSGARLVELGPQSFWPRCHESLNTLMVGLRQSCRRFDNCLIATRGVDEVYHLAADMGGIGYIAAFHAEIASNSAMINLHTLEAARLNAAKRFLFSSSACVYSQYLRKSADEVANLRGEDDYPAEPEEGYGTEKLFMEELCKYYNEDYGFDTRALRFHND
jgi:nucleoside-diphosphate-sugar epimerase